MNKKNRKIFKCLTMITQIGISMMTPIFLSAWIGWWLDKQFHTQIWFLVLLFIGMGAAFRNLYMLTVSFYSEDMKKEHARMKYIQDLKDEGMKKRQEEAEDEDAS